VIQVKNSSPAATGFMEFDEARAEAGKPKFYIHPLCGVPMDANNAKHIIEFRREKVYFCCDGCKIKFEQEPEKYAKKGLPVSMLSVKKAF
jgi:xanthine dehydrogenase accessory factor